MMDELKLNLGSKFMRGMVSKLISKYIYKKFGYRVEINLEALNVGMIDGDTVIKTNVELKMNSHEFRKAIKDFNEE